MKANVEIGLEGAFKFQLFSGDTLVETHDWSSNFITATGLLYPTKYAFAECFRFLTIGTSTNVNSGLGAANIPTTGVYAPIKTFTTNQAEGSQKGEYIGYEGYVPGSCGTKITNFGPSFFRAWYLPTGGSNVLVATSPLNINEFMVSPSSGEDPEGRYAFSRIRRSLIIPPGFRSIISYQLNINLLGTSYSGFHNLTGGSFDISNADMSNYPQEGSLCTGWKYLSGIYRIVSPALAFVGSDGSVNKPTHGCILEPSFNNPDYMSFYFSPDIGACSVYTLSGGAPPDSYPESSIYQSDGLLKFANGQGIDASVTWESPGYVDSGVHFYERYLSGSRADTADDGRTVSFTPTNYRLGGDSARVTTAILGNYRSGVSVLPTNFNYTNYVNAIAEQVGIATMGASGYDIDQTDYLQRGIFSSQVQLIPFAASQYGSYSREKVVVRKAIFSPISSMGWNTRFGSLVYAYDSLPTLAPASKKLYPVIDCLFYDSSGRILLKHYRNIEDIYLADRGENIVDARLIIRPTGTYNSRHLKRKTVQGGVMGDGTTEVQPLIAGGTSPRNFAKAFLGPYNPMSGYLMWTGSAYRNYDLGSSVYGSGQGVVYGFETPNSYHDMPFDFGIVDRNILPDKTLLPAPSTTSTIYWPEPKDGQEIRVEFIDVQCGSPLYHPTQRISLHNGAGATGNRTYIFRPNLVDANNFNTFITGDELERTMPPHLTGDIGLHASRLSTPLGSQSSLSFFCLTSGCYREPTSLNISDSSAVWSKTGKVVPITGVNAMRMVFGCWTGGVNTEAWGVYGNHLSAAPAWLNSAENAMRVSGRFLTGTITLTNPSTVTFAVITGFQDAVTPFYNSVNASVAFNQSGSGNRLQAYLTPVTGTDGTNFFQTASGVGGVYLTYVHSGASTNGQAVFYSCITGKPDIFRFNRPSGYVIHKEAVTNPVDSIESGYRLLPNHAMPKNDGTNYYPYSGYGGAYPGLGFDNGIDLYLDIKWSSKCGQALGNDCTDP